MSDVVVRVEGLSKRYRLGKREQYRALRDSLTDLIYAPARLARAALRRERQPERQDDSQLWALKDVSFEVKRGEVVGIIGRNGAGKSTLLKILSRITRPTEGRVGVRGRIGSLLEVGTGFHPELSGRENIFLNGAMLGMRRVEIVRKFDEIVAFAEVERFIDTPVKHYSSGMYTRLAFSVAAHLEPEVLVVDEVLAVGDAEFQKKCLGKMGAVAREGRTVLLVSHQLSQIRRLCDRTLWMDAGRMRQIGPTLDTMSAYEAAIMARASDKRDDAEGRTQFVSWELLDADAPHTLTTMGATAVVFTLDVQREIRNGLTGIALYSADNMLLWGTSIHNFAIDAGRHRLAYNLGGLPLRPGVYSWLVSIFDEHGLVDLWHAVPMMIVDTELLTQSSEDWQGLLNLAWAFESNKHP